MLRARARESMRAREIWCALEQLELLQWEEGIGRAGEMCARSRDAKTERQRAGI